MATEVTPFGCPGVICNGCCESCGFNPWEQKRRLKQGHFERGYVRHVLHNENGKPIHTAKNLCKRLIFKKGVYTNERAKYAQNDDNQ